MIATGNKNMIAMIRAKTNPHTGISVGQARTVAMDIPKRPRRQLGTTIQALVCMLSLIYCEHLVFLWPSTMR